MNERLFFLRAALRLGRGRFTGRGHLGAAGGDVATLLDSLGDDLYEQTVGADGVIVAGNRELNDIGVDVGVDDCHNWDPELVGLGDGDVLFERVNDEHTIRGLLHVAQTTKVALQLGELSIEKKRLLLDHGVKLARGLHALVIEHLADPLRHRFEVGKHATQPTLVHIGHADFLGIALDWVLGLLLGADEQDDATICDEITNERVGRLDASERLLEVDDVDPVALTKDESPHLRVPLAGLMSEVDSSFQHLTHADDGHDKLLVRFRTRSRRRGDRCLGRMGELMNGASNDEPVHDCIRWAQVSDSPESLLSWAAAQLGLTGTGGG